jgi:anti-sigma-K factor RskA
MKDRDMRDMTRIEELLTDRATGDLSPADEAELRELVRANPELNSDVYDRVAAELAAGLAAVSPDPLPEALADRLVKDGEAFLAPDRSVTQAPDISPGRAPWVTWSGWVVAAAAAVAWFLALDARVPVVEPAAPPTVADVRSGLIDQAATLLDWTATEDPAAMSASGDVVWSDAAQAGVMRIAGLEANDPTVTQYQLWVFDEERDERFPVDGGVFDIPAGRDEVLVPIQVAVPVTKATLFAITVERPGGVVVSDRERIVLVAQAT